MQHICTCVQHYCLLLKTTSYQIRQEQSTPPPLKVTGSTVPLGDACVFVCSVPVHHTCTINLLLRVAAARSLQYFLCVDPPDTDPPHPPPAMWGRRGLTLRQKSRSLKLRCVVIHSVNRSLSEVRSVWSQRSFRSTGRPASQPERLLSPLCFSLPSGLAASRRGGRGACAHPLCLRLNEMCAQRSARSTFPPLLTQTHQQICR